jgi:protein-tyrosine phosphatase
MNSVLVVCVGNICRSPVGERILASLLPKVKVTSAGIGALVGHGADSTTTEVAKSHGISLDGHVARQFANRIGEESDLILVMEEGHRREISKQAPHLRGRIMLFDHWSGGTGIPDPYKRPLDFHENTFNLISTAAGAWSARLAPKSDTSHE